MLPKVILFFFFFTLFSNLNKVIHNVSFLRILTGSDFVGVGKNADKRIAYFFVLRSTLDTKSGLLLLPSEKNAGILKQYSRGIPFAFRR